MLESSAQVVPFSYHLQGRHEKKVPEGLVTVSFKWILTLDSERGWAGEQNQDRTKENLFENVTAWRGWVACSDLLMWTRFLGRDGYS